ncbi:MAG: hypothetical protein DRP68_02035 [Candidatus Omnitrophota bacterium]|nr:MAG: hypothetical protein DRP68_02035 [Candidatus Omnitrophota bacterium]
MSSSKVTINEVARQAGVSIATVSRFLSNPFSVKEKNRKKLEKVIKKLHYQPFVYARKLAGGKLGVYGLIIPGYEGIFNSFYALELIKGVGFSLERKNIDLYLHIFWTKDRFNISLVDGVIFADVIANQEQLKRILKEKLPCVVINKKVEELDVSFVAVDNFRGAYQATEYLITQRHKRIAHLAGDLRVQCAQERIEGYKSALIENKIKVSDKYIKVANFSYLEARRCLEELFDTSSPPTAVFAASDEMAEEVLNFANRYKIKIPEQLSVIGFDDNPLCIQGEIKLSTVRQPLKEMASLGVDVLKEQIEKKKENIKRLVLSPQLIIRESVAPFKRS